MKVDDDKSIKKAIYCLVVGALLVIGLNCNQSQQNKFREEMLSDSIVSSSMAINGTVGQIKTSGAVIASIDSPLFVNNYTLASLSSVENEDSLITNEMWVTMQCESGNRMYDDKGELIIGKAGEIGRAQFTQDTWNDISRWSGMNGNIYSESDQILYMNWAFSHGYKGKWSCYRKHFL